MTTATTVPSFAASHHQKNDELKHNVNGRTLESQKAEIVFEVGLTGVLIFVYVVWTVRQLR